MGLKCNWTLLSLCFLLAWSPARAQGPDRGGLLSEGLLSGELKALTFEYALGSRMHRAHVTELAALSSMVQALRVLSTDSEAAEPQHGRVLGRMPAMIFDMGEGQRHSFRIAGRNQLHSGAWGRITLEPSFFRKVEAWVSGLEEARVRLTVENPFPKGRLQRLFAFQGLGDRPWQEALIDGPGHKVKIHGAFALREFQTAYKSLYVPAQKVAGDTWGYSIQLSTWIGSPATFELVDASHFVTRPLHATLLRHETLGVVWVDDGFRTALLESHSPRFPQAKHLAKATLKEARASLSSLLSGPPQTLLYRGVLPGETNLQHIWSVPARDLRSYLGSTLKLSDLTPYPGVADPRKKAWLKRPIQLGSVTWADNVGQFWTLFQMESDDSWLPPLAEWRNSALFWEALQQAVR